MTDEKVKEAVERVQAFVEYVELYDAGQGSDAWSFFGKTLGVPDIRTVLSEYDIAQAERDKLSAEVESLTADAIQTQMDRDAAWAEKLSAAEAKLTALVERLRKLRREWEAIACAYKVHPQFEKGLRHCMSEVAALANHSAPVGEQKPIPMLLFCPKCGAQHVDAPEPPKMRPVHNGFTGEWIGQSNVAWANPPHKSHLCHACGCIWRPADVPTEGVQAIETRGKADTWTAPPTTPTSAPVEDVGGLAEEHARDAGRELYGTGYHDGFVDGYLIGKGEDSYPDADDLREIIMQADSENISDGWANARDAFLAALSPSLIQPTHRHVKRGTEYEVVGEATVQTEEPLHDDDRLTVYRGTDGRLWARPPKEFGDGRFDLIQPQGEERS